MLAEQENQENVPPAAKAPPPAAGTRVALGLLRGGPVRLGLAQQVSGGARGAADGRAPSWAAGGCQGGCHGALTERFRRRRGTERAAARRRGSSCSSLSASTWTSPTGSGGGPRGRRSGMRRRWTRRGCGPPSGPWESGGPWRPWATPWSSASVSGDPAPLGARGERPACGMRRRRRAGLRLRDGTGEPDGTGERGVRWGGRGRAA